MPTALLIPVILRLAGTIAFVSTAIVAGVMNRSVLLIPLLALVATLTSVAIRKFSPSPMADIKAMMSPDEVPVQENVLRGVGRRFATSLVGYGIVFGLAALIAAIFQTTEFEPQVMASDTSFLIIPALIAFSGAWLSARMGANQMAGMMGQMQDVFAQMKAGQDGGPEDDPFTVDGEIIEPDDKDL